MINRDSINIDVNYDFSLDTPGYWEYIKEHGIFCSDGCPDPDGKSNKLRLFQIKLWSRVLPNGEYLHLDIDSSGTMFWKRSEKTSIAFGSDSITISFRYKRMQTFFSNMKCQVPDLEKVLTAFLHEAYTIGGMTIFPKGYNSINRNRGVNKYICDRWDLTLECIRLYYDKKNDNAVNPLGKCLTSNKNFFDLFVDFKGYVNFFLLQDCVTEDYSTVFSWLDTERFIANPFPSASDEYLVWLQNQLEFVSKRNMRIKHFVDAY